MLNTFMFEDSANLLLWILSTWVIANITIGFMDYFRNSADALEEKLLKRIDDLVHRVEVEKHGDIHYWFDSRDGQFLAQGRTLEEMIDHVRDRFPSHIFFVDSKQTVYKLCGPDWKFEPVAEKDID